MTNVEIGRALSRFSGRTSTAVVLGSGLSSMEGLVKVEEVISYSSIPGFHAPSVEGHPGRLSLCRIGGSHALLFAGRFHLYEGFGFDTAGGTVSLAHALGCTKIILTQAAGSLRRSLPERVWMLPSDIVLFPYRTLTGRRTPAGARESSRRTVMNTVPGRGDVEDFQRSRGYTLHGPGAAISRSLREKVALAATEAGLPVRDGILYWTPGPQYETPAEARAALELGADAAGMSSIPELAAARQCGMEAVILCWITNYTPNVALGPLHHTDVTAKGVEGAGKLAAIAERLFR